MTLYSKKRNFKNEFRKKIYNVFENSYIFWHQTAHYLRETPKSIQASVDVGYDLCLNSESEVYFLRAGGRMANHSSTLQ